MTQRDHHSRSAPAGGDVSPRMTRPHHVGKAFSGDAAVSKTAERGSIPRADAKSPAHVASLAARQLPRRFLLFAAGGLSIIASTAAAQSPCGTREAITTRLTDHYGEARTAYGIAANGTLMELWANLETGSWTVSATSADGVTCLIATGDDFGQIAAAPMPKGDPL